MTLELTAEQTETFNSLYHLPEIMARKIMRRRRYSQADLDDAVQDGLMALCRAIKEYIPNSEKTMEKHCAIVVGRRIIDSYRSRYGRKQDGEKFRFEAGTVGIEAADSAMASDKRKRKQPSAFEDRHGRRGFDSVEHRDEIKTLMRGLTKLQKRAVYLYLCEDMKVREVGEAIGKCESRAFQLINTALRHIRRHEQTDSALTGISGRGKVDPLLRRGLVAVVTEDGRTIPVTEYAKESGWSMWKVWREARLGRIATVALKGSHDRLVSRKHGVLPLVPVPVAECKAENLAAA
jgi:RNA polymerase sigma factor (sigma-70 family)